jgi:hypothetical protein
MVKAAYQMVGHNFNNDRIENDFYATPLDAIEDLIKYEKFDGKIWECSCGDGAISDPLIKAGYDVYSSDLIDRGYGEVKDFLITNEKVDNIITNPPFNLATEFTLHGLNSINKKMALLCKLSFLEGKKRASVLFNQDKLKKVLIFSRRLGFKKNDKKGGLMAFAWFIYDVNYNGKPTIDWI